MTHELALRPPLPIPVAARVQPGRVAADAFTDLLARAGHPGGDPARSHRDLDSRGTPAAARPTMPVRSHHAATHDGAHAAGHVPDGVARRRRAIQPAAAPDRPAPDCQAVDLVFGLLPTAGNPAGDGLLGTAGARAVSVAAGSGSTTAQAATAAEPGALSPSSAGPGGAHPVASGGSTDPTSPGSPVGDSAGPADTAAPGGRGVVGGHGVGSGPSSAPDGPVTGDPATGTARTGRANPPGTAGRTPGTDAIAPGSPAGRPTEATGLAATTNPGTTAIGPDAATGPVATAAAGAPIDVPASPDSGATPDLGATASGPTAGPGATESGPTAGPDATTGARGTTDAQWPSGDPGPTVATGLAATSATALEDPAGARVQELTVLRTPDTRPAANAPGAVGPAATAAAAAAAGGAGAVAAPLATTAPTSAARDARTVRNVQPALLELARGLRTTGAGHATLVVRLDPPELGPVLVRVVLRAGTVSVTCRSADPGAVGVLQQQRGDLRDLLRREGFDLADYDVRQQPDGPAGGETPADRRGADPDARPGGRDQAAHTHRNPTGRSGPDRTPTGAGPALRRAATGGSADATWL